jgi:hypothetical protein
MEISEAILLSQREDRTVQLPYSEEREEALFVECEGHDDDGSFWGPDWVIDLVAP